MAPRTPAPGQDPEEAAAAAEEARLAALATSAEGTPAPEPEDDPAPEPEPVRAAEGDPEPDPEPDPAPAPAPRRGSRTLEERIGGLARDKRNLAQRVNELETELRRVKPAGEGDPAPGDGEPLQRNQFGSQEEFQAAVRAEAARLREVEDWNNRCNSVEDKGSAAFKDRWAQAKKNLSLLDDNGVIPFELLSVALETDAPEQVILTLGEDPDRAAELLKMTPTKRALEIAKMGDRKPAPAPVRSQAPDPVEPIRGRGAPPDTSAPTDGDDDATWLRKRNAQLEAQALQRAELARKLS